MPTLNLLTNKQRLVRRALNLHLGNRTKAARALGVHVRTLERMLERWGWQDKRANGCVVELKG